MVPSFHISLTTFGRLGLCALCVFHLIMHQYLIMFYFILFSDFRICVATHSFNLGPINMLSFCCVSSIMYFTCFLSQHAFKDLCNRQFFQWNKLAILKAYILLGGNSHIFLVSCLQFETPDFFSIIKKFMTCYSFCSHTPLYAMSREAMYHSLSIPSCFDPPVKRSYLEVMTIRTCHFLFFLWLSMYFGLLIKKSPEFKLSKQKLIDSSTNYIGLSENSFQLAWLLSTFIVTKLLMVMIQGGLP